MITKSVIFHEIYLTHNAKWRIFFTPLQFAIFQFFDNTSCDVFQLDTVAPFPPLSSVVEVADKSLDGIPDQSVPNRVIFSWLWFLLIFAWNVVEVNEIAVHVKSQGPFLPFCIFQLLVKILDDGPLESNRIYHNESSKNKIQLKYDRIFFLNLEYA